MDTESLRKFVSYDPQTGALTRLVTLAGNAVAGEHISGVNASGYVQCVIQRQFFYGHRLAWQLHYGSQPPGTIDHINGNKSDNRICNLRLATPAQNCHNAALRSDNSSGVKGVFWSESRKRWIGSVVIKGAKSFRRTFTTKEAAELAVTSARAAIHKSFANHGVKSP